MPFIYGVAPGAVQTSNASPNTENDCFFIKPGTGRTVALRNLLVHGKGAQLTSISGLTFRVKTWTSTSSSAGTGITPTPRDGTVQASKCTAAYSTGVVTSGTGGPVVHLSIGCGAAGPGGWTAEDADSVVGPLESGANKSIDVFNHSGTASLNFEMSATVIE